MRQRCDNRYRPQLLCLESRDLLSVIAASLPLPPDPTVTPSAIGMVVPRQLIHAYALDQIASLKTPAAYNANAGKGIIIGVVDAFRDLTLAADLAAYDTAAHLPPAYLKEVFPSGDPGPDPAGQWQVETSLDVEEIHSLAPAAHILLVDALGSSLNAMLVAEQYAIAHSNIVTNSWGSVSFSGDQDLASFFSAPKGLRRIVTVSSGDNGLLQSPADLPNVLSIGGTALNTSPSGIYQGETLWAGSGPKAIASFDADPASGVPVYVAGSWFQVGGTSLSSPCWAAVFALMDQIRVSKNLPTLDTLDVEAAFAKLAKHDWHQSPLGDLPGHGSPQAGRLVPDLAKATLQKLPPPKKTQAIIPPIQVSPLVQEIR
jgi:hypothetical protein